MDPASAAELVRLGGATDGFVSRQVEEADLISAIVVDGPVLRR